MRNRQGQSTAEYAVVLGVVIAAVIAMQVYVKRGLQAKIKGVADHYSATGAANVGGTKQYEPSYVDSTYTVNQTRDSTDELTSGGGTSRTGITETTTRTGSGTTLAPP